jgi:hypothetical protein
MRKHCFTAIALAGAVALARAAHADSASIQDEFQRGRALFNGQADLHGRIRTHAADLPPQVVRCANCHAAGAGPDVPRSLAPRLTHDLLLAPRARRGGPPSHYDRNRFCRLLRDGQDAASMLISVEMPQYTIDDAACWALWRFVTAGENVAASH